MHSWLPLVMRGHFDQHNVVLASNCCVFDQFKGLTFDGYPQAAV